MPIEHLPEERRQHAESVREKAEDQRDGAEQDRRFTEAHRISAESDRSEAEQFRRLAEEAREVRDIHRRAREDLRDVAISMRNLVLQLACGQIIQIHLAPIIPLAEPQQLIRLRKVLPVHLVVAAFVELRRRLAHHVAHVASRRIGNAHPFLLMIT